jgi:conjugative transfer pilus assembly protein TraH
MNPVQPRIATLLFCALLPLTVSGSLTSDMTNFIDEAGGASGATPPGVYQGQSRGVVSLGRAFVRVPQRSVSTLAFRAPKITAGCGGIDVFGGSMSFISGAEIVNTIRAIGSNAGSYFMMLGLRTISSQIANTLEENFGWLRDKLSLDINSCEAAAQGLAALGGAMGVNDSEKNLCIIKTMETSGSTYAEAQASCTVSGGGPKAAINNPDTKAAAFTDGNLVWIAMSKNGLFSNDYEMRRLIMSLTGTILKRQVTVAASGAESAPTNSSNDQSKTEFKPSLVLDQPALLDTLLYGGSTVVYACADDQAVPFGCKQLSVNPATDTITVPAAQSFVERTRTALTNLYTAVRDRTDPATADVDYASGSSFPAMRIVRTAALFRDQGVGLQIIDTYAQQAAVELLTTYLGSILDTISGYTVDPSFEGDADKLLKGIQIVRGKLREVREEAEINVTRAMEVARQLEYYERIIIGSMPQDIARSLAWAQSAGR